MVIFEIPVEKRDSFKVYIDQSYIVYTEKFTEFNYIQKQRPSMETKNFYCVDMLSAIHWVTVDIYFKQNHSILFSISMHLLKYNATSIRCARLSMSEKL